MRIMGRLSVGLLVCVLLGQGMWLFRVREMKVDEFRQTVDRVLSTTVQKFIDSKNLYAMTTLELNYGWHPNNLFFWKYGCRKDSISNVSMDIYSNLSSRIIYDCLFYNNCIDINDIKSKYYTNLKEEGITEIPTLVIQDSNNVIMTSDNSFRSTSTIITSPLNLGYDYKHQITASFKLPFVFRALKGVLWIELLFLIGFVICLVWQWNSIKMTLRSVRVQTMGIAHLEHELKKPLATMISAIGGMLKRKESVLCPTDEVKLGMIKARLMKMADITDTMLTSLKTSVLEVEREPIDLQLELEMITEMFTMIRKHARVEYHIAEGLGYPCLDKIYFNSLVSR